MLNWVDLGYPFLMWLGLYPRSTTELGFKTMIITIFVLMLTWINGQPHSWTRSCPRSTPKLDFKTMTITIFIFTLTRVNPTHDMRLDQWPSLCLGSSPELSFKSTIITICILTCRSWIILELKVFYKDILRIKIINIVFGDIFILYLMFWKYRNSL